MKDTGLRDDDGNIIHDGDTIEWTYYQHGVMWPDDDGNEYFLSCVTGGEMIEKEFKETKKIVYEVREGVAGYFLDKPGGIGMTFMRKKPTCKVLNNTMETDNNLVNKNKITVRFSSYNNVDEIVHMEHLVPVEWAGGDKIIGYWDKNTDFFLCI